WIMTALAFSSVRLWEEFADDGGGKVRYGAVPGGRASGQLLPGRLQRLQRPTRVAVRLPCEQRQGVVVDRQSQGAESAVLVFQRAAHDGLDVILGERLQHEHTAA